MARQKQNVMLIFIAISIVDTFSLINQFHSAFNLATGMRSILKFDAVCRLFKWIQAVSQDCSSYFSLAYTAERFVSVRFPLQRAVMCTRRRILMAMAAITVLSLLAEIYCLIFYEGDNVINCVVSWNYFELNTTLNLSIHLVLGRYIPYIAIAILNVLIITQMLRYRLQRAQMSANAKTVSDDKAQRSMTVMLTVVSTYSIVVTLPSLISISIDPWQTSANSAVIMFRLWAVGIILPWNYCGNFFFYFLSGKQFRRHMIDIAFCRKAKGESANRSL